MSIYSVQLSRVEQDANLGNVKIMLKLPSFLADFSGCFVVCIFTLRYDRTLSGLAGQIKQTSLTACPRIPTYSLLLPNSIIYSFIAKFVTEQNNNNNNGESSAPRRKNKITTLVMPQDWHAYRCLKYLALHSGDTARRIGVFAGKKKPDIIHI